jgi:hypothetical protein
LQNLKLQRSVCRLDVKEIGRATPTEAFKKDWHACSERPLDQQPNDVAPAEPKEQRPSASRLDPNSMLRSDPAWEDKDECSARVVDDPDVEPKSSRPNRTVPVTSPRHCQ